MLRVLLMVIPCFFADFVSPSPVLGGRLMVVPNACVTLGVPVDIFDFDILPGAGGLKKLENPGSCPISDYK